MYALNLSVYLGDHKHVNGYIQLEYYIVCFFMPGINLKILDSYFQKRMLFCHRMYIEKIMKLDASIFEHASKET